MSPSRPASVARRRSRATLTAVAVSLLALVLAACSDGETGSAGAGSSGSADVSAATDAVQAGITGTDGEPPADGPAAATDVSVWIVSANQQVAALANITTKAQEAATALGWDSQVCDGQNNTNGAWANCVRQGVAAGANAILLESVDCAPVAAALGEAKAAGVLIAGLTAFDCDDPTQGASDPLFDVTVLQEGDATTADVFRTLGALRADWIIDQTDGAAQVVHVEFGGVSLGTYLSEGFVDEMATCSGCEIVSTVTITPTDVPNIRQKFETALLQAPQANAVAVDVDFMLAAGVQQALTSAGRDLTVAGGECGIESIQYINAGGGAQMCIGQSLGWLAYASVDGINRVLAGEPVVDSGLGYQIVDTENNLPDAGDDYESTVDYAGAYASAWGV